MIKHDFHLHSTTSTDGRDDIAAMCAAGERLGMEALCFTEHDDAAGTSFALDVDKHRSAVARARSACPGIKVLRGIEAGYEPAAAPLLQEHIKRLEPDFILLSVHSVGGLDPYYGEAFFGGRPRAEALRDYLGAVLEAATLFPDYDALAHIGYAGRYAPPDETPVPLGYAHAPDVIDAILRELIRRGAALEVNTSQMRGEGRPIPDRDILERYAELGGRAVTLGSDAHGTEAIGRGFEQARQLLLSLGFTHYCAYEGRRQSRVPLA